MIRHLIILVSMFSFTAAVAASEPAICKQIRQRYNPGVPIRAEFDLSIYWSVREKTSKTRGTIMFAPGNRFRVEAGNDVYVSDGRTCWQYSKANNQVVIRNLSDLDPSTLPSRLLTTALSDYRFSETGRGGGGLITLTSAADTAANAVYRTVRIDVNGTDGAIVTLEATDRNGNIHTYRFKKTEFGKPADGAPFTFKVPTDANVIDHRN